jgi:TRAP-type C4-dicarboxylate transport system permease small subunit
MDAFSKVIEWISNKLKIIGAACLVGMIFLTCADVVGRFFRHPIFGSVELVATMSTLAIAMALPYTHINKGHVGVELLVRLLSAKTQLIIDTCTAILSLALFALVTWRMALYANTMHKSGEVSLNLQFPTHIIIYIVSFCFLIFLLFILQDIVKNIKRLKSE